LIFSNNRLQNGNEILFLLGVLLVGYVATELAQQIDVIHECRSPFTKTFSYEAKERGIQEIVYGIEREPSSIRAHLDRESQTSPGSRFGISNVFPLCQFAQLTAASPALRLVLAVAGEINAASNEFQTQNGTAAGVQTLCHHLPQGAVWPTQELNSYYSAPAFLWKMEERQ
jgi:hypothetical protein